MRLLLYFPFFIALPLAPLLFGSVKMPAQVALGALLGLALLLCRPPVSTPLFNSREMILAGLGTLLILLTLVPLPTSVVELISPARAAMAKQFPVHAGIEHEWIALTLSPARTIERLWQLALVVAAFLLARHGTAIPGFDRLFISAITLGVITLTLSEWWIRYDGQGPWAGPRSSQAGTFFNRNHFSNWIIVASLFLLGPCFALLQRSKRKSRSGANMAGWGMFGLICLALFTSLGTGSRGGLIALSLGLLVLVALTTWTFYRSPNFSNETSNSSRGTFSGKMPRPRLKPFIAMMTALLVVICGSAFALDRLAEGSLDFRARIWSDSLRIFSQYPLFGTGLGTFMVAFNYGKTFHGSGTFIHAENDYVQTLMEVGLAPLLPIAIAAILLLLRFLPQFRAAHTPLSPLLIGTLAAVTAFLAHASCEFVFQTTANAILFSALIGFGFGLLNRNRALNANVSPTTVAAAPKSAHFKPEPYPIHQRAIASNSLAHPMGEGRGEGAFYRKWHLLFHSFRHSTLPHTLHLASSPSFPFTLPSVRFTLAILILAATFLQARALTLWNTSNKSGAFGQLQSATTAGPLSFKLATVTPALAGMNRAINLWPLSPEWQLIFARSAIAELELTPASNAKLYQPKEPTPSYRFVRQQLNHAIALDPYNWRLRLERAWLDLAFSPDFSVALAEANEALRLNPLHPELPFQFAEFLARRHPAEALKMISTVDLADPQSLRKALSLAWKIEPDPAILWNITPATTEGLLALGDFAASANIRSVAGQAYKQLALSDPLRLNLDPKLKTHLAKRFLQLGKPEESLKLVHKGETSSDQKLTFLALTDLRRIPEAITIAEKLCREKGIPNRSPEHWTQYEAAITRHDFNVAHGMLKTLLTAITD